MVIERGRLSDIGSRNRCARPADIGGRRVGFVCHLVAVIASSTHGELERRNSVDERWMDAPPYLSRVTAPASAIFLTRPPPRYPIAPASQPAPRRNRSRMATVLTWWQIHPRWWSAESAAESVVADCGDELWLRGKPFSCLGMHRLSRGSNHHS